MSKLSERKTRLVVESSVRPLGRPLRIEIEDCGVRLSEKGRRYGYKVSWDSIFWMGVKQAAEERRMARGKKR